LLPQGIGEKKGENFFMGFAPKLKERERERERNWSYEERLQQMTRQRYGNWKATALTKSQD